MKITCATYPSQQLPGGATQKPGASPVKQDLAVLKDVFAPSSKIPPAVLGCIQTIEQATSDIMNLTGNALEVQQGVLTAKATGGAFPEPPVTRGDTFIFLPGAHRGAGPEETPDRLVIIKGMVQPGAAGMTEASQEDAAATLMNHVARKLSRTDYRPGLATVNPDSPRVVEKFIISVDMVDDAPVPVVIRHDPSGGTALPGKGGEPGGSAAVPKEVRKIAVFLAGLDEEKAPREDLPVASNGSRPGKAANGDGVVEKLDRPACASLLSDPAAVAKGIGQAVSRFLFGEKDHEAASGGPKEKKEQYTAAKGPEGLASPVTLAGVMAGVVVKLIGGTAATGPADDSSPAHDAKIVEKVVRLVAAVNGLVETIANGVDGPADDDGATTGTRSALAKEAVRQAVKASFETVLNGAGGYGAGEAGKTPGITLDETGLLKLDRAVLIDSLSTSKGETVRFVHDFTVSLHDRIIYNACAFMGLYTGGGEPVVDAPGGKEGTAGEDADRKADFEKRFKELQMLLKNSYELKESFMKRKSAAGDGRDEEAQ
ncbi:MAG TPA: hypothetical protein DDZ40_08785 [Deltaproteobacteria bacterium]|nr:hypothetical protein [Deltaproteobacteria bacterium]